MELAILIAILAAAVIILIVLLVKKPKEDNRLDVLAAQMDMNSKSLGAEIDRLNRQMAELTNKNYEHQVKLLETLGENADRQTKRVGESIASMQESNEKKLEQIREMVDEKLTKTLNDQLNASFKTVSEQLQNVYKSLGEMKELSSGVTDHVKGLNRVLTNVKARGTWAEVQLGNILNETLPGMYETNVKTNPKYNGMVEFAIKIPSMEDDSVTWLPIDSKFPMEDYIRLSDAAEVGDTDALNAAKKALEAHIKDEAKKIKQYIAEPHTTPFAILYLATEGLYAEVYSSRTGLPEKLQQDGIMLAGPSTIIALLNSLAMGFRTMAINQKADEVWKVLGAAKVQYDKFGEVLQKAKKKILEAGNALDDANHRNEIIQKRLRKVETLEADVAGDVLEMGGLLELED